MTPIRLLPFLNTITWTVATVRVWDDAHNPYTTGLCALIATGFTTYTLTQPRKENHNEPHKDRS